MYYIPLLLLLLLYNKRLQIYIYTLYIYNMEIDLYAYIVGIILYNINLFAGKFLCVLNLSNKSFKD